MWKRKASTAFDCIAPKLAIRHQEKFRVGVERKQLIFLWSHKKSCQICYRSWSLCLHIRCLGMYDKNAALPLGGWMEHSWVSIPWPLHTEHLQAVHKPWSRSSGGRDQCSTVGFKASQNLCSSHSLFSFTFKLSQVIHAWGTHSTNSSHSLSDPSSPLLPGSRTRMLLGHPRWLSGRKPA